MASNDDVVVRDDSLAADVLRNVAPRVQARAKRNLQQQGAAASRCQANGAMIIEDEATVDRRDRLLLRGFAAAGQDT
jgi:hypothetical protein